MARPIKEGLSYYPMDVDFLHDIKIRKVVRANGAQSVAVLLALLGNIYGDHGYYMQWDDDVRFLVADEIGISEAAVGEIVKKALSVRLFDQALFDKYGILTSHGIQERYLKGSKRKTKNGIKKEFSLLVNAYNNPVNVNNNPAKTQLLHTETPENDTKSTQKKLKETKQNKNKQELNETDPGAFLLDFIEFWNEFPNQQKKKDSQEAYEQARMLGTPKDILLKGAVAYRNSLNIPKGKTSGYATTADKWIDGERWTDEYHNVDETVAVSGEHPRTREDWLGE